MDRYQLKPSVKLESFNDKFIILDLESGVSASGNIHSFKVIELLKNPLSKYEIIECLKCSYHESQYHRIKKSVPNIIEWLKERELISIITKS